MDCCGTSLGKRFFILVCLEILKILDSSLERYNNNNNKLSRLVVKMNYSWILFTNVASPFQVQGIAVALKPEIGFIHFHNQSRELISSCEPIEMENLKNL